MTPAREAVVIGAGPNGLAAAVTLARAGVDVTVYEAAASVGGGTRTAELTLPGFRHDVCSAVHPLAAGSPFLRSIPLDHLGCDLVHPDIALAHPLDGARKAALHRSLDETVAGLGDDGPAWRHLMEPIVERWDLLDDQLLGPVLRPPHHPFALARFGVRALRSSQALARRFETDEARGLLAGLSGHSFLPLDRPLTGSFALVLGALGHVHGWPFVRGGSQSLADALVSCLESLGGTVVTEHPVISLDEVTGPHRVVMADVTPTQLAELAADRLSAREVRKLTRFRHGPGVCKVDFALSEAVPWTAEQCRRAGTVHVGGRFEEIAEAEAEVAAGRHAERPFVLVAQPSLCDPKRAPAGRHTLWAYCHVPNGSTEDRSEMIIAQIERFAPGFRDTILAQHTMTASQFETYDASFVGGDISAGSHAGRQLLLRPYPALDPYRTAIDGVYLCSGSTPPGGGVHGMCGYHAARAALRRSF